MLSNNFLHHSVWVVIEIVFLTIQTSRTDRSTPGGKCGITQGGQLEHVVFAYLHCSSMTI